MNVGCPSEGWEANGVVAGEFTGPVIYVLDGDTIEVLHNNHPERIRLSGSFLTIPLTLKQR